MKNVDKNPEMIHELIEKRKQSEMTREEIAEYIHEMNRADYFIDST